MLAAERGYKMKIVMPSNMSEERKQMLKFYGADLIQVEAGDFDGAIETRDTMAESFGWFNCNQFHNPLNVLAHYNTTGPEIDKQFRKANAYEQIWSWPQAFVAGTGTGGTIIMSSLGFLSIVAIYILFERYSAIKKASQEDENFLKSIRNFVEKLYASIRIILLFTTIPASETTPTP